MSRMNVTVKIDGGNKSELRRWNQVELPGEGPWRVKVYQWHGHKEKEQTVRIDGSGRDESAVHDLRWYL